MKIFNRSRALSCEVEVTLESFGRVAVYDDRISIEYHNKALDKFIEVLMADAKRQDETEPDAVLIMLVPNIQRRRFDLMLYIRIHDCTDTVMCWFGTETKIEERRFVVDTILSHREAISDELYDYYTREYERWREE